MKPWVRWWGIRHLRWLYWHWRFWTWWFNVGRHYWLLPSPRDEEALAEIWRGEL
jgi:hypothetical protein